MAEVERHAHPIDRLYAQLRAVHAFHQGRESRHGVLVAGDRGDAAARGCRRS
jgi:hypothetical protein